jgi:CpeT protein
MSARRMKNFSLPCLLLLSACTGGADRKLAMENSDKNNLPDLYQMMQGHFDSSEQAGADKDFFAISLVMTPILPEISSGYWLYVEQAVAATAEKPYRQRAYFLHYGQDGSLVSEVFTLRNPELYVRGWETGSLKTIDPVQFEKREGCAVYLQKQGDVYVGGTRGKLCLSDLRGATYATSMVEIRDGVLTSWDQGFDANDKQVWGAVKGPYVFKKKK